MSKRERNARRLDWLMQSFMVAVMTAAILAYNGTIVF